MLKETDKLLDPMTIYISFVTALYLLFTKKRITWNIRNQDIAQLFFKFVIFCHVFDLFGGTLFWTRFWPENNSAKLLVLVILDFSSLSLRNLGSISYQTQENATQRKIEKLIENSIWLLGVLKILWRIEYFEL